MSSFDTNLNVVNASIGAPDPEALDAGAPVGVEIAVEVGMALPFSQGPGQPPIVVRTGTYRFGMDRDVAVEFFKQGLAAAEALPAKPKIDIATNLAGVEQAAAQMASITGKK